MQGPLEDGWHDEIEAFAARIAAGRDAANPNRIHPLNAESYCNRR